jgi:hypothetical protein
VLVVGEGKGVKKSKIKFSILVSAKLGGWLGVVMGASLCSFSEMIVYIICFTYKLIKKKVSWPY